MKTYEANRVRVGEHTFYIFPFKAFVAANLSGDLMNLAVPIISSVLPMVGVKDDADKSLLDIDVNTAAPAIVDSFSAISGNRLEAMLKKLLIVHENITVDVEEEGQPGKYHTEKLTEDLADDIFCGEVQDMYILAFEVIRLNLNGFFKKLGTRFGGAAEELMKKVETLSGTGTST